MEHRQYAILHLAWFTEPLPDNDSVIIVLKHFQKVLLIVTRNILRIQIVQDLLRDGERSNHDLEKLKLNSSFMVKSERAKVYTYGLFSRYPLDVNPSSLCPDPDRHREHVQTLPLCAACPSCWSTHRLGKVFASHVCGRGDRIAPVCMSVI